MKAIQPEVIGRIIELLLKSYAMTVCELAIIYYTKGLIKLWRK